MRAESQERGSEQEIIDVTFYVAGGRHLVYTGLAVAVNVVLVLVGAMALAILLGAHLSFWLAIVAFGRLRRPHARLTVRSDQIAIDERELRWTIARFPLIFRSETELGPDEWMRLKSLSLPIEPDWIGEARGPDKLSMSYVVTGDTGLTVVGRLHRNDAEQLVQLLNEVLERLRAGPKG